MNSATTDGLADPGACLVVIYGDELGRLYSLNCRSVVIGRSAKCEIQINQESISRHHTKIVNAGKAIVVRDLGSTNGTYVNDQPIEQHVLRDGDLIKVGRTIFKFLGGQSVERAYHEEMHRLAKINSSPHAAPSAGEQSATTVSIVSRTSGTGH